MRNSMFVAVSSVLFLELVVLLCHVVGENILGKENDDFDFDGMPGAQHEFKVYIPGSMEDCFFQSVVAGAKLHFNYEILKGEKFVDLHIRDPQWNVIETQSYKSNGQYSLDVVTPGTYAICIHNAYSRYTNTLVYMYIVTFVMHEWMEYQTELGEINILAANFSTSLTSVQEMVSDMQTSQARARFHLIRDWYLVHGNNDYVQRWSIAQCVLIVAASIIQVFSVRRLFRTTNVTPTTSKPRA